jgi:hypothetical protein
LKEPADLGEVIASAVVVQAQVGFFFLTGVAVFVGVDT